jgi:hypothetical protein
VADQPPRISRRATLLIAGLALAEGAAGGIWALLASRRKHRAQARDHLIGLARSLSLDEETRQAIVQEIGAEIGETPTDRLANTLLDDLGRPADDELRSALAHRVEHDFANGRTVLAAGWVLSLTEARFLMLAVTR